MGMDVNENVCPAQRCDICKDPAKLKLKWDEYEKHVTSYGNRVSLLDLPVSVTSLNNSKQFQSAKEMQSDIRLKDGSLASFAPQKRSYDSYLGETTMQKLETQQLGFQNSGNFLEKREFLFGKKGKRREQTPPPDLSPAKYQHLHPKYLLAGCTGKMRDKSIDRIIEKLRKKLDSVELTFVCDREK
jgi:hypothetical protein